MKLKEIVDSHEWLSVKMTFQNLYPDQEKSIEGYEYVFEELKILKPAPDDMLIVLSECDDSIYFEEDEEDIPSTYIDVSGRKPENTPDSEAESYALEFHKWENWLGMDLAPETIENFTELEIIAHCLYEMTFFGFDQNTIQDQLESLKSDIEEYENMSEDEKKANTFSLEELMKELDREDDSE